MKASEQLAKWISDENDLYGTSQDEILTLVFQYPAVASYKLMLAKWQFLRYGAVEEGLWQQLLLQWPNPAQLFEWRSKSFNFNKEIVPETALNPEMNSLISEEIPAHDQPLKIPWDWGQYLREMDAPVAFVWEMPEAIEIVEIGEIPVFEYLLQTESELESISTIEGLKITEELPILKEEITIEHKPWNWVDFFEENLDHLSSVWISDHVVKIKHVEDLPVGETEIIAIELEEVLSESIPDLEKNNIFSDQSTSMHSTEEFQASAFVQWLQSRKPLQVKEISQRQKSKHISESGAIEEEKEQEKEKPEHKKEKIKERNKERDKHKKKDKKKKKLKKKDKLEEEIFSSLEFSDDVASETYAALLAKQGHYELSERIYERLRLIYPEKSSYFAGLIKKLKS